MIDNEDYLQLSEYYFNVCEVLKTIIQGKNADNVNESVRKILEDLESYADWLCSCLPPYRATLGSGVKSSGPSRGVQAPHT